MAKRKRKKNTKRVLLVTVLCLAINAYIIYSVGSIFSDVYTMKNDSQKLNTELQDLKEKEEILKSEVKKLKDPVYVAKYAREKFLYSGDNEYIIRMK